MMNMEQFKNALRTHLLENKGGKIQGNQEWISLTCPFCGDSVSNKPHLNVRIPLQDNIFFMMCFQPECDVNRFPRAQDIIALGFTDLKLLELFSKESINIKVERRKIEYSEGIKYPTNIAESIEQYIYKRTNIPKSMYAHYRIVGNVRQFLKENDYIDIETKHTIMTRFSDNNIIGFLNTGKSKLQIRNLNKKEYIPYTLISSAKLRFLDEHSEYEQVLRSFDLVKNPVIVLSEGNFDRLNSMKLVDQDGLYVSGLSAKGIFRVFKKYSKKYHHVRWIIISDKDVPISLYVSNIVKPYGYRIRSLEVWYNGKDKDFGDLSEEYEINKHVLV